MISKYRYKNGEMTQEPRKRVDRFPTGGCQMEKMMTGKAEQAYLYIREKIIRGNIEPMTDISEELFMEELSMSRTPVREAMLRLADDGFIMIFPRKGTFVSAITMDTYRWVNDVRLLCEPWMCANACGRIPRETLLGFRDVFSALLEKPDKTKSLETDDRFHELIMEHSDNPFIRNMMSNVQARSRRIRFTTGLVRMEYEGPNIQHLKIVDALLSGDPSKCREAMEEHIRLARVENDVYFA